jgi:hypothetical protein
LFVEESGIGVLKVLLIRNKGTWTWLQDPKISVQIRKEKTITSLR